VSYTVVVDTSTDPKNRKQVKKTFKKKGDADAFLAETINSVKKGVYFEAVKTTTGEWLTDWLKSYCKNLAPTTYQGHKMIIEKHLIPALGDIPLKDLKPKDISVYYQQAIEGGRKDKKVKSLGAGLSTTTVSQHHRVLREALQHALQLEMIYRNPADAVKPPKKVKHEIKFLPVEDANKIIDLFTGSYLYMPVFLAVTTGARRAEILALRWSDVDLKKGIINIGRGLYSTKEQGLFFKEPKNRTSKRAVNISAEVIRVLKKHKTEQKKSMLSFGKQQCDDNLICSLQNGDMIVPATVTKRFQELTEAAGYKLTFHQLRHAHASYLLKQGIHPKVVAERLGHSNISITMDLYSHIAPTLQRDAANQLEDILFKK
jgi:integrase